MKKAKNDKPIQTMPKGAYETGIINKEIRESKHSTTGEKASDAQKNGYPNPKDK